MTLRNGTIHGGAIVLGGYGYGSMAERTELDQLRAVLTQIRGQFSLAVRLGEWHSTGALPNRHRSSVLTAGENGLVARIKNGSGFAHVPGVDPLSVDYGQWIYLMPGRQVAFEGAVISGMNLNVIYAQLAKS